MGGIRPRYPESAHTVPGLLRRIIKAVFYASYVLNLLLLIDSDHIKAQPDPHKTNLVRPEPIE